MKKKLVLLLSVVLVMCGLLCACGSNSNYVGVWKNPDGGNGYMYVYEDGTGDYYGKLSTGDITHFNAFAWEVKGGYLVMTSSIAGSEHTIKYKLDGTSLLDSQGKVRYELYEKDTSVDWEVK